MARNMANWVWNSYNAFLENLSPLGGRALRVKINETDSMGQHLLFWGTGAPGATTCNCPGNSAAGAAPGAIYMRFDGDGSATPVTYVNIGTYASASWSAGTAIAAAATLTSLEVTGTTALDSIVTFGSSAHDGLLAGAGKAGASAFSMSTTANKNALSFYITSAAVNGTTRGNYTRLYLTAGAGGEAGRFYTTVSNDTPADTVNGVHCSLSFGASAGNVTGLGTAGRFTLAVPAGRTLHGTVAAVMAELASDGSSSAVDHASFLRCVTSGTGNTCFDDTGYFFEVQGLTANTGKMLRATAPTTLAASLRVLIGSTTYYLPLYSAAS